MQQQTVAEVSLKQYRKPTYPERFLGEMSHVMPWVDLVAVIEPYYPKLEGGLATSSRSVPAQETCSPGVNGGTRRETCSNGVGSAETEIDQNFPSASPAV